MALAPENPPPFRTVGLFGGGHSVLAGNLLTRMGLVEAELVAAVMADGHSHRPEVHDLNFMRMTQVGAVGVVAPVHGGQGGPDDRVGAVRRHTGSIGTATAVP